MKKSVLLMMALLVAAPLFAQERRTTVTVWASQVEMQGENDLDGGFTTDFEDGNALGASVNVFVARMFSVEASVFGIRSDAAMAFEGTSLDLGSIDLVPVTLGVQLHPFGSSRFDPYVGAGGAYVMADDLNSNDLDTLGLGRIELENELTYYLNAGVGFQITEGFGLVIDGRYIPYETSSRSTRTGGEQDLEFGPQILSAGLRFRF
ncbi:MAG TPA: OmpW family outer membrane protein [Thermoanaerobaculia bacterium]|jgi:outer membrane protein